MTVHPNSALRSTAIVTASWRGDFDRCRLLCESIDRRVSGQTRHLILVEGRDAKLFKPLAGRNREIVDERDVLPAWLRAFPDPTHWGRRRVWLSPFGPPLRGWHVQQLRRIVVGTLIGEDVMVSVDSDVVFLKPFDVGAFADGSGRVRFFHRPQALRGMEGASLAEHRAWSRRAGALLGIEAPAETETGYIATLIAWRTASVRAMAERIEAVSGRSLVAALASSRVLSECVIYGRFVDEVEKRPDLHHPSEEALCHIYWRGAAMDAQALSGFAAALQPHQVAAGIQSFTGTDPLLIRRAAGLC